MKANKMIDKNKKKTNKVLTLNKMFDNISSIKQTKRFKDWRSIVLKTLKKIRESKGLTQEKVAKELNITKEYLSMLERAERNPSDKLKEKMSRFYKLSTVDIFLAIQQTKCLKRST